MEYTAQGIMSIDRINDTSLFEFSEEREKFLLEYF